MAFPRIPTSIEMLSIIVFVFSSLSGGQSATFMDEDNLRSGLFVNYSNRIRPVLNQSDTLVIKVNMSLLSIQDLNAKNQVLKTSLSMALEWVNELLTWKKEDYGGIEEILVVPSQVWIPDIVVYNGANGHSFLGNDEFLIRLRYDGKMNWYPGSVLETQCSIAIAKYPFDTQRCEIQFSLWMNPASSLRLFSDLRRPVKTLFKENGEWEVVNDSVRNTSIIFETDYSFFTCELVLKRRVAYHVINTVLPILLLSVLNVLVFVLPPEAGEKMSLSITVLLAYAVFLSIINESMPTISTSVSILAVYVVLILGLGTLSTFLSAVVLHYAYMDDNRRRRFFSLDFIRDCRISTKPESTYSKKLSIPSLTNQEVPMSSKNSTQSEKGDRKSEAGNEKMKTDRSPARLDLHSPMIQPKARDLVDKIDVISFWVFLALTILIFVVIISVLTTADI